MGPGFDFVSTSDNLVCPCCGIKLVQTSDKAWFCPNILEGSCLGEFQGAVNETGETMVLIKNGRGHELVTVVEALERLYPVNLSGGPERVCKSIA